MNEAIARALWLVTNAITTGQYSKAKREAREALEVLRTIVTAVDTISTWLSVPGRTIEIDSLTPRVTISWGSRAPGYQRSVTSGQTFISALGTMAREVQRYTP